MTGIIYNQAWYSLDSILNALNFVVYTCEMYGRGRRF